MGFRGCEPGRMAMSVCTRMVTAPLLLGPTSETQCFSLTGDSTRAIPKSLLDCLEQHSLLYPAHGPGKFQYGQRNRPSMQCIGDRGTGPACTALGDLSVAGKCSSCDCCLSPWSPWGARQSPRHGRVPTCTLRRHCRGNPVTHSCHSVLAPAAPADIKGTMEPLVRSSLANQPFLCQRKQENPCAGTQASCPSAGAGSVALLSGVCSR